MKRLSRREITEMLTRSKLDLWAARDACAQDARAAQAQASAACRVERSHVIELHEKRRAAYQEARGSFGRSFRACKPSVEAARATAPQGKRREAAKAARGACRTAARRAEAQKYGAYYRARRAEDEARATRKTTCDASKGVRRRAFDTCIEAPLERHAADQRRAAALESQRRQDAKLARGGRRQPVSPGERQQEEIDRARNDLDAYPDGARLLFEEQPGWFVKQWKAAVKRGRRISLGEWIGLYAEENPDLAAAAEERAADAWIAEQWAKYNQEAA